MEKIVLTKKQHAKLSMESNEMQREIKKLAVDVNRFAAMGDLSENAEYISAKERQRYLFNRMEEVNDRLSRAVVVQNVGASPDQVGVGTTVKLVNLAGNREEQYHVVGSGDFDFDKGELPATGPIGRALVGCFVDDVVQVETPAGQVRYRVKSISRYDE